MGSKFSKKLPKKKAQIISCTNFSQGCQPPLLAKSLQRGGTTLAAHLLEAAEMALTIATINNYPKKYQNELQTTAFVSALFHDVGKAAAGFQEMIKCNEVKSWPDLKKIHSIGFRHEMLSAVIFYWNVQQLASWQQKPQLFRAAFLAIITHHKPYQLGQTNYPKSIPLRQWPLDTQFKIMYQQLLLNKQHLQEMWHEIIEQLQKDKWAKQLLDTWIPQKLEIPSLEELTNNNLQFDRIIPGYKIGRINVDEYLKTTKSNEILLQLLVKALINTGDHLSSGTYFNPPPIPDFSQYDILPGITPYPYQKQCGATTGHVLLRAPTGSGKSEAFGLWIQKNQLVDNQLSKVYVLLPFQASSNAMFGRLTTWLSDSNTTNTGLIGLNHSRAATVLYSLIEEELYGGTENTTDNQILQQAFDPWSNLTVRSRELPQFSAFQLKSGKEKARKLYGKKKKKINASASSLSGLSREIFYPVKISTPYQLLKGLLQGRGWESIVSEFYNACFVYDEIHAYEPNIVGLILRMSKILIEHFNARIMFMSATFPDFLIARIKETIPYFHQHPENFIVPDSTNPEDAKLLNKPRHIIQSIPSSILQTLQNPRTIDRIRSEESTLIICNTVKTAQQAYKQMKQLFDENTVLLFHSRFKLADRREKEKTLLKISATDYKIVVATQVVEVSLDIDFAYGIIETAPLDALIQRLGRVNRKGKRDITLNNILLTAMEDNSKYVYDKDLTQRSFELIQQVEGIEISETKLVELVNQLYSEFPWTEEQKDRFEKAYNHPLLLDFPHKLTPGTYRYWIEDVLEIDNSTDIILEEDQNTFEKQRRYNSIGTSNYIIPIRLTKKIRPYVSFKNTKSPPVLYKYSYSKELGLQFGDE